MPGEDTLPPVIAQLRADISQFESEIERAEGILEELGTVNAEPKANLNDDGLLAKVDDDQAALSRLGRRKSHPPRHARRWWILRDGRRGHGRARRFVSRRDCRGQTWRTQTLRQRSTRTRRRSPT